MTAIRERIANLTRVPARNAEHMQVLRYEKGQFYRTHHDQNSPQTSAWGPRLYTFFMYLNDVDDGGQTCACPRPWPPRPRPPSRACVAAPR